MKIHHLPNTLISQIAAGEVIERPASVLKELIENSIDAGATVCDVELEQGGVKTLAVRDNGCGMAADDALMSFARHATSKIASFEDLISVASFGFRGEALAAISSVAHVTMHTREKSSDSGTEIVFQGGLCVASGPIGCAPGTAIVVKNLFFNTPVRKKFLKTETTELQQCILLVTTIALAHPEVAFSLSHNGRELLNLPAAENYIDRIGGVLGNQFVRESSPVQFVTPSVNIQGFIGKPGMTLSSKRHQYLFVNGRAVTDAAIARAVLDAYGTRLPARTYPMFILFVDVDPHDVDVNVHPRKLTVKFAEPGRMYRDTLQAVKQSLDEPIISTAASVRTPGAYVEHDEQVPHLIETGEQSSLNLDGDLLVAMKMREHNTDAVKRHVPLAQVDNSYILTHDDSGLVIVDQHAAHERIMYEKFKAHFEKKSLEGNLVIQRFLMPITLELTAQERVAFNTVAEFLAELGFEFASWSGNVITVEAAPNMFREKEIVNLIKSLFAEILDESSSPSALPERLLKSLACKAAVKFGMQLALPEQTALLEELSITANNATCPHGRPTHISLSYDELEKRFYRKK